MTDEPPTDEQVFERLLELAEGLPGNMRTRAIAWLEERDAAYQALADLGGHGPNGENGRMTQHRTLTTLFVLLWHRFRLWLTRLRLRLFRS
jgi:hypothetical protein